MQVLSLALPLAALASGVFANPLERRGGACNNNACLAAVTGKGALGDGSLRGSHCASFLATTVTPPAITVTETVTGAGSNNNWKRASVTVCPNEVPNYASACDEAAYTSACSCFGFTAIKTTTIAPTTTTKTVYVAPTGGSCATVTKTATVVSGSTCPAASTTTITVHGSSYATATTVTVTAPATTSSGYPTKCNVNDAVATTLVNNFMLLLTNTSFAGNASIGLPAGHGYPQAVSDATLDPNFVDISDSINFMAGFPLGSITFPNKAAFDYGQGVLQPEVAISALNIWHDCNTITWRWRLFANPKALPVTGINYMIVGDNGLIIKNYAEFDNGAWLQSFGQKCAINTPSVSSSAPALKRAVLGM